MPSDKLKRLSRYYTVVGQVQRVCFRATAKQHADRLGVNGFVRNLSDGTVELCITGTEGEALALLEAMFQSPPPIHILSISIKQVTQPAKHTSFEII